MQLTCAKLKCATFACLINEMFDNVCLRLRLRPLALALFSFPCPGTVLSACSASFSCLLAFAVEAL